MVLLIKNIFNPNSTIFFMKPLFFYFLLIVVIFNFCNTINTYSETPIIKEEVTANNQLMVCLVGDLCVRYKPSAPKPQNDATKYKMAHLDQNDEVVYLGEKSNLEEHSYPKTFPDTPKRKDYWYKVRFKINNKGRHKGKVWIGWVHGGGMRFKPQPKITPAKISPSNAPERYVVLAGVSDYSDNMNSQGVKDLNYCDEDVNSLYDFLISKSGGSVPNNQIIKLLDSEATVENIIEKCNDIYAQAGPKAIIIFYFSGHGSENQFIAYDGVLLHSQIKSILKLSTAQRQLVIADACYSGSIIPNAAATEEEYTYNKDEYGIAFFMSSRNNETSAESDGHGVFTGYVIKGLDNCNANKNNDKVIDIEELSYFVKENMKNIEGQTPKIGGTYDHEMPIMNCSHDIVQ
jgi:Caspase domain